MNHPEISTYNTGSHIIDILAGFANFIHGAGVEFTQSILDK
jgi:hypothetical protein